MVRILSLTDSNVISIASEILFDGGVIIYPTDTLYGFGIDAANAAAIDRLNTIKKRNGPITVMASDIKAIKNWCRLSPYQHSKLMEFRTETSTFILPVKSGLVDNKICGADGSLGIRIPGTKFCNQLSACHPNPITSTSVNVTGQLPLTNVKDMVKEFGTQVDLVIDGGKIEGTKGSRIYNLMHDNFQVLR